MVAKIPQMGEKNEIVVGGDVTECGAGGGCEEEFLGVDPVVELAEDVGL